MAVLDAQNLQTSYSVMKSQVTPTTNKLKLLKSDLSRQECERAFSIFGGMDFLWALGAMYAVHPCSDQEKVNQEGYETALALAYFRLRSADPLAAKQTVDKCLVDGFNFARSQTMRTGFTEAELPPPMLTPQQLLNQRKKRRKRK